MDPKTLGFHLACNKKNTERNKKKIHYGKTMKLKKTPHEAQI